MGAERRRFVAPARGDVVAETFSHPLFDGLTAYRDLLLAAEWPGIDGLNTRLPLPGRRFIAQDEALLDDGLHYEVRVARGRIATRPDNWHDLLNALIWARYPALKAALNARQCLHVAGSADGQRNRAQQALTQFDESGVIVRVRDASLLEAWDRHDWSDLFRGLADHWRRGDIAVAAVVGHALMEQALLPGRRLVGKCLVVCGEAGDGVLARVAGAIAAGEVLEDPLELRPLPLAGIPDWHPRQGAGFYAQADYFRPLREGRVYPPPLS
ncbi:DUF3025 domain-containing protein [Pseudomonas sp. R2.Fl]|nr:DUF3025 domain-containing protein [Pseudomonas sp. R2.Fl]